MSRHFYEYCKMYAFPCKCLKNDFKEKFQCQYIGLIT